MIANQIKIGQAIKQQRIAYVQDLDEARSEKQEWVLRSTDLLKQLFTDATLAEQFNDWVGPILPEYAEWGLFVDQFTNEMKHRLGRLQAVVKQLEQAPEPEAHSERKPMSSPTSPPSKPHADSAPIILLIPRATDEQSLQPIRQFLETLDLRAQQIDVSIDGAGGWQLSLARQLKSAGVAVDLNRLI